MAADRALVRLLARWAPVGAVVVIVAGSMMTAAQAVAAYDRCVRLEIKIHALELMSETERAVMTIEVERLRKELEELREEVGASK